jgi:hypothetical protein
MSEGETSKRFEQSERFEQNERQEVLVDSKDITKRGRKPIYANDEEEI